MLSEEDDYTIHEIRDDDTYLTLMDRVIIGPTIIDINYDGNFLTGLRMPVQKLVCKSPRGVSLRNRILNVYEYFIVDKLNEKTHIFSSQKEFESRLQKLKIDANLNDQKFEATWSRFSALYKNDDITDYQCVSTWLRSEGYLNRINSAD